MKAADKLYVALLIVGGALAFFALDGGVSRAPVSQPPLPPPRKRPKIKPVYLTDDVEVAARVIRSELGSGTRRQKEAIVWVTRNMIREKNRRARERGEPSVTMASVLCNPCGYLAPRLGREVSTAFEPKAEDRAIAAEVMAKPDSEDPTAGATHFVDPRVDDYPEIRKRWIEKYKWEPFGRIGEELELWGPSKTQ